MLAMSSSAAVNPPVHEHHEIDLTLVLAPAARRRRRRRVDKAGVGLWCFAGLVFTFLFAPIAIILLTSLTSATTVEFPPPGFSAGIGIECSSIRYEVLQATHPGLAQAIWFSLYLGMLTTFFATLSGILCGVCVP